MENNTNSDVTIEEGFKELNDIIIKMDKANISLEESFELYDKGLKLVKKCNEKIEQIEQKIQTVNE